MISRKFITILRWILPGFPKHAAKIIVVNNQGRGSRAYDLKGMKWIGRPTTKEDFNEAPM